MAKVILYIATSTDGYIADENRDVGWLPHPNDPEDLLGYHSLMQRIRSIVMGHNSYKQILEFGEWAWKDKKTYVFSALLPRERGNNITFIKENPKVFIEELKRIDPARDIWLLGGAKLISSFEEASLIEECIITTIPLELSRGIKLTLSLDQYTLLRKTSCMDGISQYYYIQNK